MRPILLAHYMPWFVAKPFRQIWGWHWTMNAFDPEKIVRGKRSIAAHYYPLIGPYDSGDPSVIEYHLLLMRLAGIDGILIDWYGLSNDLDYPVLHQNTQTIFDMAAKIGVQVGICYEDQTITRRVEAKKLAQEDRIKEARRELDWLRRNWFSKPAYLKYKGKPVLLSFGYSGLTDEEWETVLPATANNLIYLSEHRRRGNAQGAFDWPQPASGVKGVDAFYRAMDPERKAGHMILPVAFPRFHDIYKEGRAQEGYPLIPDDGGRTFATTFDRAVKSGAPLVQIATWNDWGEGTIIEPTEEFGYRDLETIQRFQRGPLPGFNNVPEDLRLPYRLYRLRQKPQASRQAEADRVARLLIARKAIAARTALDQAEK